MQHKPFLIAGGMILVAVLGAISLISTKWGELFLQELGSLTAGKGEQRGRNRFEERLRALGLHREGLALTIEVSKRERKLRFKHWDVVLAEFPIALGPNPEGHKQREGDGRTPEGEFYVCTRNESSRFHLFLGLSYPSPDDGARALSQGLLTATETEAILDAWMKRVRPPWGTILGGTIGIHGFGAKTDWTQGCIALHNGDIEELFWNVDLGTRVVIKP